MDTLYVKGIGQHGCHCVEGVKLHVSNPHDYINHMFKRPYVLMNF
jgi:hypothetical protein